MASSYPGALDALTNPTATDAMNSVTVPHATQHANANDAIEAIQAELGTDPAGASATVKARLDALDTSLAGKLTTPPAWTSYTPTWSGVTLGDGYANGEYAQLGKVVHFKARLILGSTSAVTGGVSVSLPVTEDGVYPLFMQAFAIDDGAAYVPLCTFSNSVYAINVAATYAYAVGLSSTVPFTWAPGDSIYVYGTYETNA